MLRSRPLTQVWEQAQQEQYDYQYDPVLKGHALFIFHDLSVGDTGRYKHGSLSSRPLILFFKSSKNNPFDDEIFR